MIRFARLIPVLLVLAAIVGLMAGAVWLANELLE